MTTNQQTVRQYIDAFNRGDLDGICACFAPDALIFGVLGWGKIDVARPIWKDLIESLQLQFEPTAMIEQDNIIAVRIVERGKSVKPFRGHPATGKTYEVIAIEWLEMKDGKILCRWGARDSAAIFRQLGFAAT